MTVTAVMARMVVLVVVDVEATIMIMLIVTDIVTMKTTARGTAMIMEAIHGDVVPALKLEMLLLDTMHITPHNGRTAVLLTDTSRPNSLLEVRNHETLRASDGLCGGLEVLPRLLSEDITFGSREKRLHRAVLLPLRVLCRMKLMQEVLYLST